MSNSRLNPVQSFAHLIFTLLLAVALFTAPPILQPIQATASLPDGFGIAQVASGLANVTSMAIANDGRIFITQQEGTVKVIQNGIVIPTPVLKVTTSPDWERGLTGIALDPDFLNNGYLYLAYTVTSPKLHHQVSRFKVVGNLAVTNSEKVIYEMDDLLQNLHVGGALAFGPDGKLYIASGESNGANQQAPQSTGGKIIRINSDGSIPGDNPFRQLGGRAPSIFAMGFRNPFTLAIQRTTGKIFVNDVGDATTEEVNEVISGGNYGWPAYEGYAPNPFISPLFTYPHGANDVDKGCAIVGGTFYNPNTIQFPTEYVGKYFFADFCNDWIRTLDPTSPNKVKLFASNISGFAVVNMQTGPDGAIYLLARGITNAVAGYTVYETGAVYKIFFGASPTPNVLSHPQNQTISAGAQATFSVNAAGQGTLKYQWQKNGVDIQDATEDTYITPGVALTDNNARYRVIVSNFAGSAASNEAILTVTSNKPPIATINFPLEGSKASAGETVRFSGSATDPEKGVLPDSAFVWSVRMIHGEHSHPVLLPKPGISNGSFSIPRDGHPDNEIFYRVYLDVSDGIFTTDTYRDIYPRGGSTAPSVANANTCTSNTNRLANPGFEDSYDSWDIWDNDVIQLLPTGRTGNKALQIGTLAGGIGQHFYTTTGDQFVATAWARLRFGAPNAKIGLSFFDAQWQQLGSNFTVTVPPTATSSTRYFSYTLQATAPSNAAIGVLWAQKPSTGYLDIDDFCLARSRGNSEAQPISSSGFMRQNANGEWEWYAASATTVGTEVIMPLLISPRIR